MIKKCIVLLLFSFIISGCGAPASFTMADFGKTVQLRTGASINIILEGNPTTGYTWEISKLPSIIKQTKEPDYKVGSNLTGAGGKYTFYFTAVQSGKGMLELIYRRPWEKAEPINAFYLNIDIK